MSMYTKVEVIFLVFRFIGKLLRLMFFLTVILSRNENIELINEIGERHDSWKEVRWGKTPGKPARDTQQPNLFGRQIE